MVRGYKIMAILSTLAGGALLTLKIFDEIWPTGFSRSYYRNKKISRTNFDAERRQEFFNLLNYLQRKGFVEKKKTDAGIFWKITSGGLVKLKILKNKSTDYQADSDGNLKIIIFDVPEKERKLRAWLRSALKILGFRMLQQSVWIGKGRIPELFLFDLRQKNLLPYIHIMEVNKGGTVKELS
ncbi:CRISPR-associated endonuclease Cas2 [Candidatus Giovannonibacteria bacterium RIFCSPHIGHO2_02_43_13]|uniref:CRISPR-associated endonuclease Cas2 n=1 Tax=Candidatus Giovannonibacteria bacterium RIFCSPHIGHO2_02_43_13 TaxID=1798330 RepID=A0A1F5WQG0_9BACT|nr:MAG: CRISPR-associated endonuclease Cas2 [Candidatus Giovannonibacteria bacterium RIFCSPHIGHO2_12_FULL_44_42]OGF77896.1 MAG: CRISPR-associated endonuclease Cas2 [Candidatus Giovannonibacteria bacterium RIFCSPHIGHO2_02_43_13]OGF90244.1 MAG: CRISPR-associated endonuclease Cas2 [Candidatus Giovannonibacteria bacterium RIFCSPLOWO2_02_FULL_43_54]OGF96555.1 MAG: CRISPR-associated endonuclease Cas2 [Candidatus Giovannonibacteria bacterium RIFCSPLOWO2_12_FULL_44_32]